MSLFSGSTYASMLKHASVLAFSFQSVNVAIENANASLTQAIYYVIGSGHLGSPMVIGAIPAVRAENKKCYVITRETLAGK